MTCAKLSFDASEKSIPPELKLGMMHETEATTIVLSAHGATK